LRRHVASRAAVALTIVLLSATGALALDRSRADMKDASARLPANYRQLMADFVRTHNPYVVIDAKITKPYEGYGGLLHFGTVPAVCVAVFRKNVLGFVVRDNWVMTVENGKVEAIPIGLATCSDLSPFTELMQRR
jgi:hypothetical protein